MLRGLSARQWASGPGRGNKLLTPWVYGKREVSSEQIDDENAALAGFVFFARGTGGGGHRDRQLNHRLALAAPSLFLLTPFDLVDDEGVEHCRIPLPRAYSIHSNSSASPQITLRNYFGGRIAI